MKRCELKKYDPFPLNVGESRTVDGFTFSFRYGAIGRQDFTTGPMQTRTCYQFCIENAGDERISEFVAGYWYGATKAEHKTKPIVFMENSLRTRKIYTKNNILWAFQKGRTDYHKGVHQHPASSTVISRQWPSDQKINHPNDPWLLGLKTALEKDFKTWKAERKVFKKTQGTNTLKNHRSDVEETIRTNDLMECLPMIADLESAIACMRAKGDKYTKSQVTDISDAINKLRYKSALLKLRKHGG